jgi:predicted ester cyclase
MPVGRDRGDGAVGVIERLVEVMNACDLEVLDELFTEDFVDHNPLAGQPHGIEGLRLGLRSLAEQGDDVRFHLEDCFSSGDLVAYRIYGTWSVRPRFAFQNMPGALASMNLSGVGIYRCRGDRLAERWGEWSIRAEGEAVTVRAVSEQEAAP